MIIRRGLRRRRDRSSADALTRDFLAG